MAGRTKALGAALVTALACAGLAAAAFAGVDKYDTKLTITRVPPAEGGVIWQGEVKSEKGKCERGRRVVLFKERPGADHKLATTRSTDEGSWSLDLHRQNTARLGQTSRQGGYAKVKRESGNGYVCRADRAPNHGTV